MSTKSFGLQALQQQETDFLAAIEDADLADRDFLRYTYSWSDALRNEGLVRLRPTLTPSTKGLKLCLLDEDRCIAWFYVRGNAALELFNNVLKRRAPHAFRLISEMGVMATDGTWTYIPRPSEELLEAIANAYREAARLRESSVPHG